MISPNDILTWIEEFLEFTWGLLSLLALLPWAICVLGLITLAKPDWTAEELEDLLDAD